jgi:hypothetical protein
MGLAGHNLLLNGTTSADPGALADLLVSREAFECAGGDCVNLNLTAVGPAVGPAVVFVGEKTRPPIDLVAKWVDAGNLAIAHVRNQSHFVLTTLVDKESRLLWVNDPGFPQDVYNFADASDFILFQIDKN